MPLFCGNRAPPLFFNSHRCGRENSAASADGDECRPCDIDHAETIVGFAVKDVAGMLVTGSRPLGKTLQVDVPLRIEWYLFIPVVGNEPFRLACGAAFPLRHTADLL